MSFNQLFLILRARWKVVGGVFLSIVFLVLLGSLLWTKQYSATASVVVDTKSDPVSAGAAGGAGAQQLASYVNTQADIIASVRVAQRVVKMLKLDQDPVIRGKSSKGPDEDISVDIANDLVDKRLTVAPVHDSALHASNVIDITVKWPDAKMAAALANAFAEAAIETNIELKVEPAKQYASWFDQRSRALHADLEAKQKVLSDYQTATGIIATDEKLDVENARLTELSTELVTIQGLRQDSQSRQRQASGAAESLPEVLQSPVVQSLKASLAIAESKIPDIVARLGKNHPDYQAAEAEIANLRDRIARESASIAASLGNTTQINVRRENDIRAALDAQKKRVLEFKHQHDQAAILQSDVTSAQRDLDEVTQRLAQSNLESLTQQTNVVQLTTATEPSVPSSPKLLLNLVLAIFLGGVFGVGAALVLELSNRRVREDEDIIALLGVPLLGSLKPLIFRADVARSSTDRRLEPSVI